MGSGKEADMKVIVIGALLLAASGARAQPTTNPAPSEAAESVTVTATALPRRPAVDE